MSDKRKYADRAKYLIRAVAKRRKKIREMAIEYKGGKCELCGYDRCFQALDFHHIGSTGKDFGISDKGYTRSWEKVKKEIDKCILVCANCHRELHVGFKQLPREIEVEKRGELREA
jgi:predicted HNH restriction endonuclease